MKTSFIFALFILVVRGTTDPTLLGSYQNLAAYTLINAGRLGPDLYPFPVQFSCPVASLPPLMWDSRLYSAAQGHSNDMSSNKCFSHYSCNCAGSECDFSSRIKRAGGAYGEMAENIVMNGNLVDSVKMWFESAGHCRNIFNQDMDVTGVGYSGPYGTQTFANSRSRRPTNTLISGVAVNGRFLVIPGGSLGAGSVVRVVINGQTGPNLLNQGFFVGAASSLKSCDTYFFELVLDSGDGASVLSRFPEQGTLVHSCTGGIYRAQAAIALKPSPSLRSGGRADTTLPSGQSETSMTPGAPEPSIGGADNDTPIDESGITTGPNGGESSAASNKPAGGAIGSSVFAVVAVSFAGFVALRLQRLRKSGEPVNIQTVFSLSRSPSSGGNKRPDSIISIFKPASDSANANTCPPQLPQRFFVAARVPTVDNTKNQSSSSCLPGEPQSPSIAPMSASGLFK